RYVFVYSAMFELSRRWSYNTSQIRQFLYSPSVVSLLPLYTERTRATISLLPSGSIYEVILIKRMRATSYLVRITAEPANSRSKGCLWQVALLRLIGL